jgi:subtilisin family serine protease
MEGDQTLRQWLPDELLGFKGAGVRVAVIDSGVNSGHPHVGQVTEGVSFRIGSDGRIEHSDDFSDRSGHGTACAAVIRGWAPLTDILAVKILDDRLFSQSELLIEAIEWAHASEADIINMSLGTHRTDMLPELDRALAAANESGAILISSTHESGSRTAPARFDFVLSTAPDFDLEEFQIRSGTGEGADFILYPYPREAPGIPRHSNFQGPSFASAHLAGLASILKEKDPGTDHEILKKILIGLSG